MESAERRTEGGRRVLYRRGSFNPNYKGWQRRVMLTRRLHENRRM